MQCAAVRTMRADREPRTVALGDRAARELVGADERDDEREGVRAGGAAATMRGLRTSERSSRSTLRAAGRLPVTSLAASIRLARLSAASAGACAARPAPSDDGDGQAAYLRGLPSVDLMACSSFSEIGVEAIVADPGTHA